MLVDMSLVAVAGFRCCRDDDRADRRGSGDGDLDALSGVGKNVVRYDDLLDGPAD